VRLGLFRSCGGSEEWGLGGWWVLPRDDRAAAARVMRARRAPRQRVRAGLRRDASLGQPDKPTPWRS